MWTAEFLAAVFGTFLVAGFVKGVVGMGLPTVSLAILTAVIGLRDAMALMLVPSFLTNIWQMLAGPYIAEIIKRFWLLIAMAVLGTFAGLQLGVVIGVGWLVAVLGGVLLLYAIIGLLSARLPDRKWNERLANPVMGFASGVMTGLVGIFIVPTVFYLQALKLDKDMFVQTLGGMFVVATLVLGAGLSKFGLLSSGQLLFSTIAVIPAFAGMWIGQGVRRRLTEDAFRKIVFVALGIIGAYLILRAYVQNAV